MNFLDTGSTYNNETSTAVEEDGISAYGGGDSLYSEGDDYQSDGEISNLSNWTQQEGGSSATGDAATEGAATDDAATEGDATEGDATEGDATEGDATEGDATESASQDDVNIKDVLQKRLGISEENIKKWFTEKKVGIDDTFYNFIKEKLDKSDDKETKVKLLILILALSISSNTDQIQDKSTNSIIKLLNASIKSINVKTKLNDSKKDIYQIDNINYINRIKWVYDLDKQINKTLETIIIPDKLKNSSNL